jgi:hypothetical protein
VQERKFFAVEDQLALRPPSHASFETQLAPKRATADQGAAAFVTIRENVLN